ncbi:MAG: potassium-transporting ATPase subunit KdpC [Desulfobulbus sp.]|jgi:K+-transporting ATPase ATPase C chain|uniref:potassium-transporting ATPase subunit KdpC n=1 Tax=Desulfobulbus sp. TaxID=895 RepID=UPI00283E930E|nr:potassium-transporting ATPase subunit KdpC [Desulfobulbus sp.]MDR2550666.1 potassium-transporting ATPase subunit KdpC [Desulfobulbus sp.]
MKELKPALLLLLALTLVCGGLYPALVTGLAQALFPVQANGSLIAGPKGKAAGSLLIGQPFSEAKYLWPRPSATGGFPYNPLASGGANLSPAGAAYGETIAARLHRLQEAGMRGPIAADLVQASGSGLDPHISPHAAATQIRRIAQARGMREERVAAIVAAHLEPRQFGLLGEPRVNVLAVNLALDAAAP